ncbi:MAG: hypothetical protein ACSLE5_14505 [Porticoccaceae bacterium]
MGPEISQFLSGMKKTMEDVVIPNLTDRFAQEQAGIVAASLGFLGTIHDKAFHYELLENHRYKQILQTLLATLTAEAALPDTVKQAIDGVNLHFQTDSPADPVHLRTFPFIRASNETMKELLCGFIQALPELTPRARAVVEALLKPLFKDIENRERAWVKALGFDPEAASQPDIEDLLYENGFLRINSPASGN